MSVVTLPNLGALNILEQQFLAYLHDLDRRARSKPNAPLIIGATQVGAFGMEVVYSTKRAVIPMALQTLSADVPSDEVETGRLPADDQTEDPDVRRHICFMRLFRRFQTEAESQPGTAFTGYVLDLKREPEQLVFLKWVPAGERGPFAANFC